MYLEGKRRFLFKILDIIAHYKDYLYLTLGKGVAAVYDKEGHIMGSRQVKTSNYNQLSY